MSDLHMKETHNKLQNLPQLFDIAHDFAYSPIMGKGELDTPISGGTAGFKEPGRFNKNGNTPSNDPVALEAYRQGAEAVASAYFSCVRIALNNELSIPYWPIADTLHPVVMRTPSPYELGHGCRILTLAFLRLYASSAAELCVTSSNGNLVGGPALSIERAYNKLQRVVGSPHAISEPEEPTTMVTRAELSEAARKQIRRFLEC